MIAGSIHSCVLWPRAPAGAGCSKACWGSEERPSWVPPERQTTPMPPGEGSAGRGSRRHACRIALDRTAEATAAAVRAVSARRWGRFASKVFALDCAIHPKDYLAAQGVFAMRSTTSASSTSLWARTAPRRDVRLGRSATSPTCAGPLAVAAHNASGAEDRSGIPSSRARQPCWWMVRGRGWGQESP